MATNNDNSPTRIVFAVLDPESRRDDAPKSKWIKLGVGWDNQDGSISCVLDAFPLAWSAGFRGQFKLVLQEPRSDEERPQRGGDRGNNRGPRR